MTALLILLAGIALVLAWLALVRRHAQQNERAIVYRRWSAWERDDA